MSRTHFSYLYIQSNISVRAGNGVFGLVGALCLLLHFHCVTERENYYVGLRFCTSVCLTVTGLRVSVPGIAAPFALINVLGMMSRSNESASFSLVTLLTKTLYGDACILILCVCV